MKDKTQLQIKDIVAATGIGRESLRFYEKKRLITPQRTSKGYRIYSQESLAKLQFIKLAQEVGFSLQEIGEVFKMRSKGPLKKGIVAQIAKSKVNTIDDKIKTLISMRKALLEFSEKTEFRKDESSCFVIYKVLGDLT